MVAAVVEVGEADVGVHEGEAGGRLGGRLGKGNGVNSGAGQVARGAECHPTAQLGLIT